MQLSSSYSAVSAAIFSLTLTGCSASFQPVLPDYAGENAAYLRFDNSPVYTSLRQAAGQTLQPVPYIVVRSGDPDNKYSVNARFSVMGIKSSYGKKIDGSGPVSSKFIDKSYKEYRVRAGETYAIKWIFTEKTQYNSWDRVWSASITPKAGHTYEVTIGGGSDGNDVIVSDVTSS
jgi:hypothetical protein